MYFVLARLVPEEPYESALPSVVEAGAQHHRLHKVSHYSLTRASESTQHVLLELDQLAEQRVQVLG